MATWLIGVPSGFLMAFYWQLPIQWVYLVLSCEEVVRLLVGYQRVRSRKWLRNLVHEEPAAEAARWPEPSCVYREHPSHGLIASFIRALSLARFSRSRLRVIIAANGSWAGCDMDGLIEQFLDALWMERGLAEQTLQAYSARIWRSFRSGWMPEVIRC